MKANVEILFLHRKCAVTFFLNWYDYKSQINLYFHFMPFKARSVLFQGFRAVKQFELYSFWYWYKVPKWETTVFEAYVQLKPMKSFLLAFMSVFHVESLITASEWEQRYCYVHVSHMFVNDELLVPAMACFTLISPCCRAAELVLNLLHWFRATWCKGETSAHTAYLVDGSCFWLTLQRAQQENATFDL